MKKKVKAKTGTGTSQVSKNHEERERPTKVDLLVEAASIFGRNISPRGIAIMANVLDEIMTDEEFEHASKEALKEARYMPTIPDYVEARERLIERYRNTLEYKTKARAVRQYAMDTWNWGHHDHVNQQRTDEALVAMGYEAGEIFYKDV